MSKAKKPAVRLGDCKNLNKRLGISETLAATLTERFPTLKLTPRTEHAFDFARKIGESMEAVDDLALLESLLKEIADGRFGAPDAKELIDRFGDITSVVTAGLQTGLTHGEVMRLSLAVALCLNRGARGIKLKNRRNAAYFFGEVYMFGVIPPSVAYLDGDFKTLEVAPMPADVPEKAKELGAKYVIAARRDDGRIFDMKSECTRLKKALEAVDVTLADCLVFDGDGGYAAFDVGSALKGGKIEFVYYE